MIGEITIITPLGDGLGKQMNDCYILMKLLMFWQMTTAISIEDVRREVKILQALTGHENLVQFYDAYEDENNVYVVME